MEKSIVIALRKKLKMNKNLPLIIESDENYIVDERCNLVMWDDDAEIVYSAGPNQHRETNVGQPAALIAISYDNIARMEGCYRSKDFEELLNTFVSDGKTNQESVDKLMDMIFNLTDINMYIAAKDRDPDVLKKVDVATGHYSNEEATPYEEPTNTPEVNPVITDMSVYTDLGEVYAQKLSVYEAQAKHTLKDPVKPTEPEKTYEDRRKPKTEEPVEEDPNTTTNTSGGTSVVVGGGEGPANMPGLDAPEIPGIDEPNITDPEIDDDDEVIGVGGDQTDETEGSL